MSTIAIPIQYCLIAISLGVVIVVWKRDWIRALLCSYMFLVFSFTVLKRTPRSVTQVAVIPFWSYLALFRIHQSPVQLKTLLIQMIANVIMFIPIGLLAGKLYKWRGLIVGIAFSVCIEFIQLFVNLGLFEFDDIFHNSLGTFLGVFLVYRWHKQR